MNDYIIACDVGGTRIKAGIIDADGNLSHSEEVDSQAHLGTDALLEALKTLIKKRLPVSIGKGNCLGIGLGLTGPVDSNLGVILLPGKFDGLEGFPIVPLLREEFKLPVFAENDGRLAAYAAKYYGNAKDVDWAVVITLGTGVGSGVIINGEILVDPHFNFGIQIGHLVMDASNNKFCLTGNYGTAETLCSATALVNQVRTAIQRGIPSSLSELYFQDPLKIGFKEIAEACREGDELCLRELEMWKEHLTVLLINATHAYGPQKIILSGGASLASDIFLDDVQERVNKRVFRFPKNEGVPIEISIIQEYAGVYGAAAMLHEKLKKQ
ncbi:ROK family protein [Flavivirga amylovorans]|uniref:ROK family protein n=1 Tax=Flavivirga amylovorans TaxID=870486 RepID=A0ABT8WYK9_9FLAO|nr:ROK family protein [Flavivirga amylovorans]MDO5986558.1 ROK family protein [Flavivirga amylovorans]